MSETPDSTTPELEKPPGGQPDVERADMGRGTELVPPRPQTVTGDGLHKVELYQSDAQTQVAGTGPSEVPTAATTGVQPAKEVQTATTSVVNPVQESGMATPIKISASGATELVKDQAKEQPVAPVSVVKTPATEVPGEVKQQTKTASEPRFGAAKTEFQPVPVLQEKNTSFAGAGEIVDRSGINSSTAFGGRETVSNSVVKESLVPQKEGYVPPKETFVQAKETPLTLKEQGKTFENFETTARSTDFGGKTLPNMKDTYSVAQASTYSSPSINEIREKTPVSSYTGTSFTGTGFDGKYAETGKYSADLKMKIAESAAEEFHPAKETTRTAGGYDSGYKPKPEYSFASGETQAKPYYPNTTGGQLERVGYERNFTSVDHGMDPNKLGKLQDASSFSSGVNMRATEYTPATSNPKVDKELLSGTSAAGYSAPSFAYEKEKYRATEYGGTAAGAIPNKLDYYSTTASGSVPGKLDYAGRTDYASTSYPSADRRVNELSADRSMLSTAYDAKYEKYGANSLAGAQPAEGGRFAQAGIDGKVPAGSYDTRTPDAGRAFETARVGDVAGRTALPTSSTELGARALDAVKPAEPSAPRVEALASRGDHPGAIPSGPAPVEHALTPRPTTTPVEPVRLADSSTHRPADVPTAVSRPLETPSGGQPGRPTGERYVEYVPPGTSAPRADVPVVPAVAPPVMSATSFARTTLDASNAVPVDAKGVPLDGRALPLDARAVPLDGRLPIDGRLPGDIRSVALPVIDPRTGLLVEGRVLDGRGVIVPLDGRAIPGGDTRTGAGVPVDGRTVTTTGVDGRGGMTVLPDGRIVPSSVDGRGNADGRGIQTGAILDGRQTGLPGVADARTGRVDVGTVRVDGQPAGRADLTGAVRAEPPGGTRVDVDGRAPIDRATGIAGHGVRVDADGVVRIVPAITGTTEGGIRSVRDPLTGEFIDDGGEETVEDDDGTIRIRKVKGEKRYITGVELAIAGLITAAAAARHRSDGEEILNGNIDPDRVLPDVLVADGDQVDPNSQEIQANAIMARRSYLIAPGDTFQSIAERFYRDSSLGWLIADLNSGAIKESKLDGKRVLEVACRQVIELPDFRDIQAFRGNKPRDVDFDAIVTIVTENSVDKELLQSYLGRVTGDTKPTASAAVAAIEGDAVIVEGDELKIKAKLTKPRHLAALLKGLPDTVAAMTRNRRQSSDSSV